MSTLVLRGSDVRALLDMRSTITAVEQAFLDYGQGHAEMPPKAYLVVEGGDFRAMPAALPGAAGVKWVNVHPGNPSSNGLPTVMAIIIYSDPATGYPLAIMDATDITAFRTGAAAAVASKYLARRDSRTLGIVGAGKQAQTQLLAHVQLFRFDMIKVYDISPEAVKRFASLFPEYPVQAASIQETVSSDIVCTVTPARAPFLKREWLHPGTHINAVGADAEGKEELEPDALDGAMVVVDDVRQASAAGEINVPVSKGLFHVEDIYAELGQIVAGNKPGRQNPNQVTIFDSTGIGIEDIAIARLIYEKASSFPGYLSVDMVAQGAGTGEALARK